MSRTAKHSRLSRSDLVRLVANRTGKRKIDVDRVLNEAVTVITDALVAGDRVNLTNLGAFEGRDRSARIARNPRTGESVQVPSRTVPVFIPSTSLKRAVR